MSVFEDGRGWPRWRAMSLDQRQQAAARTAEVIAELLAEDGRTSFPNHPVTDRGAELSWHLCDTAFEFAKRSRREGTTMFDRWLAQLEPARKFLAAEEAEWLRGGLPVSHSEPPRSSSRERTALARLEAPLVVTTKRQAEAA